MSSERERWDKHWKYSNHTAGDWSVARTYARSWSVFLRVAMMKCDDLAAAMVSLGWAYEFLSVLVTVCSPGSRVRFRRVMSHATYALARKYDHD